jgi:hypothetical protein
MNPQRDGLCFCGATFLTSNGLRCSAPQNHVSTASVQCVLTNQCPFCRKAFSTLQKARDHVSRQIDGRCRWKKPYLTGYVVAKPADMSCPLCFTAFESLDGFYDHLEEGRCDRVRLPHVVN